MPLAIKKYHEKISQYNSNPGNEDTLILEYKSLFKLIDLIKEASISENYLLHIKLDYTDEYNLALENAADLHYKKSTSQSVYLLHTLPQFVSSRLHTIERFCHDEPHPEILPV